jgi:ABC-type phosphate transport system substrate-binding protein
LRAFRGLLKLVPIALFAALWIGERGVEGVVFVVNEQNPIERLSASDVASMFLKKKREWPDGTNVRFIDRKDGTPERQLFLSRVLTKSGRDVELYWIGQKLYSGDAAPMQVGSDASVAALVSSFRGAIGYVSPAFPIGKGLKKVEVE